MFLISLNLQSLQFAISPYVCVSGGKKCSFFGKFGVPCFLETPVLKFALLSYYRRFIKLKKVENWGSYQEPYSLDNVCFIFFKIFFTGIAIVVKTDFNWAFL